MAGPELCILHSRGVVGGASSASLSADGPAAVLAAARRAARSCLAATAEVSCKTGARKT